MNRKFRFLTVLLLFLVTWSTGTLPGWSGGYKYFRYYSSIDYNRQPQNWSIIQDKRGIIYAGNQGGLLEFDGAAWRTIRVPNDSVRSLAIDENGTIYVGGKNEIGYLSPGTNGTLQYVSLLDHLNEDKRNIGNVWRTHSTRQGIYFQNSKYLLRWQPTQKSMKIFEPDHLFKLSFLCNEKLLIRQGKVGLMQIEGDSVKLLPGGETFAEQGIFMVVPYDTHKLLIGTSSKGFYLYNSETATPFFTEVTDHVKAKGPNHGIRLANGNFAIGTRVGGLVIFDSLGNIKQIYDKDSGLPDDNVKYVFEDFRGNLWLALNNGIAKIENRSRISIYDNRSNLPGLILSVSRHGTQKNLYAGTSNGLYTLTASGTFRAVPGISGMCNSILSIDTSLLTATINGIFQVGKTTERIGPANPSYVLYRSRIDQNRIWAGTAYGLLSLLLIKGRITVENTFKQINQSIRRIAEDKHGNLWLGTLTAGALLVEFPVNGRFTDPRISLFDRSKGLPQREVYVVWAAGHVMFATRNGIFRYNEELKSFFPDNTLGTEFAGGDEGIAVFRVREDQNGHIWFHSLFRNFQAIPRAGGGYVLSSKPFSRMSDFQVNAIYPDPGGDITWFAGNNGLLRYDKRKKRNYDFIFPALIHPVIINNEQLLPTATEKNDKSGGKMREQDASLPEIKYEDRNLRFEFAAPFFEDEAKTVFQSFLEGYDNSWSAWTPESRKDYPNLDSRTYRFRVRAKNVYEHISPEASFRFKILPPWYKTWWAFLLYATAFLLLMFLVVRWRSIKHLKDKQRLEQIIVARTREINEKNIQLEKQTSQLKEQSGKLKELDRIKSRFFANISHEFRTPLTLIMGPLEQIRSEYRDEKLRGKADLMLRSSRRLLGLINQLLDLSKLDSGEMQLQATRQDIIPFLKGVIASFESLSVQEEIDLEFITEQVAPAPHDDTKRYSSQKKSSQKNKIFTLSNKDEENIYLYFEVDKLEQVINNLLLNAFKFTPRGGRVTVAAKKDSPPGFLKISIKDSGIGIPKDQLPFIFDRFYQVDHLAGKSHKGTGIGLALSKELVTLHHGEIDVCSSEGKGTEFIIRLPMGKTHLKEDEIIEHPQEPTGIEKRGTSPTPHKEIASDIESAEEEPETEEAGTDDSGRKNLILIVEDNADVRRFIREPLQPLYTIAEAGDGAAGIKKAKEIIPDLIISDIMMPGVDGYELCSTLKKDIKTSHVPIVLLTAKAGDDSIIHGLETGADDYITKPFNTRILLTRIKNLIDLRKQLQQKMQRQLQLQPAEISISSMDREFMTELQELIEKNLRDPGFNVDQLCKKLYMSRATLYRKIEALTGESPIQFIRSYRLKRAAQLLKANFGNVTEVAYEAGFASSAYFTKCFKEKFHQLPSDYQAAG